jgi:hypothetical protein
VSDRTTNDEDLEGAAASRPATRIEVVGGGSPTDEQLAATVVALTPVAVVDDGPAPAPAWARAALLEGVGGRRPARPSDLDVPLEVS